jgi:glycosyltransferase involved in cell wall biosynthesis
MSNSQAGPLTITFVCQWFPPEPADLPLSMAAGLAARGHDVQVITGIPNYPDGKVKPGYRAWRPIRDSISGMTVWRTPLFPSHSRSASGRIANYLSWSITSMIAGFALVRRSNVVLVYSSPATAAIGPFAWSILRRTPYVLLIEDMWPDSVTASKMLAGRGSRLVEELLHAMMGRIYRKARHIAVSSPGMTTLIAARGAEQGKTSVIYNWAPDERRHELDRTQARDRLGVPRQCFLVTYAGNLGVMQDLGFAVEAVRRCGADVTLLLVGDGVELNRLRQLACDSPNVLFLPRVSAEGMPTIHAATDVHLVSLISRPIFASTMPLKVQSILAAAKPVIAAVDGDAAAVVSESGAGWVVPPGDAERLAAAIAAAQRMSRAELAAMGERGKRFYSTRMSQQVGVMALERVLADAAQTKR